MNVTRGLLQLLSLVTLLTTCSNTFPGTLHWMSKTLLTRRIRGDQGVSRNLFHRDSIYPQYSLKSIFWEFFMLFIWKPFSARWVLKMICWTISLPKSTISQSRPVQIMLLLMMLVVVIVFNCLEISYHVYTVHWVFRTYYLNYLSTL